MALIGYKKTQADSGWGGGVIAYTFPQLILSRQFTSVYEGEEIFRVGVRDDGSSGGHIDIAVYDTTNGPLDCSKLFETRIEGTAGGSFIEYTLLSDEVIRLTKGNTYGVAIKTESIWWLPFWNSSGWSEKTLTGSANFPATMVCSENWGNMYPAYAEVRVRKATRVELRKVL